MVLTTMVTGWSKAFWELAGRTLKIDEYVEDTVIKPVSQVATFILIGLGLVAIIKVADVLD